MSPLPFYTGMLTGIDNYTVVKQLQLLSIYEVLPCLEDTVWLSPHGPLGLKVFPYPLFLDVPCPWELMCD